MAPPELSAVTGPSACCYLDQTARRARHHRARRAFDANVSASRGGLYRAPGLMHKNLAARRLQPDRSSRVLHSNSAAAGETSHRPAHAAHFNIAAGGPQFAAAPNAIHRNPPASRAGFEISVPAGRLYISAAAFPPALAAMLAAPMTLNSNPE